MPHRPGTRSWRLDLPQHEALEGLSEPQRLEIIEEMNVHLNRHPAIRIMTIVAVLLSIAAGVWLHGPPTAWFQSLGLGRFVSHMLGAGLAALVTVTVGLAVGYWLLWGICARAFRGAMREIGRDVCLSCGYWLRGLDDEITRCPECGAQRAAPPAQQRA